MFNLILEIKQSVVSHLAVIFKLDPQFESHYVEVSLPPCLEMKECDSFGGDTPLPYLMRHPTGTPC